MKGIAQSAERVAIPLGRGVPRVPGRVAAPLALAALGALLVLVALAAVGHGAYRIAPGETLRILLHEAGLAAPGGFTEQQRAVLMTIRLPRVLLGALVGAGLAATGAAMQGLFRNPLADPGLIGVSSGAALAASAVIVVGALWLSDAGGAPGGLLLPLAAFLGALAVSLAVYRLSSSGGRTSLPVMLLAGIAFNALAMAGVGFFTFIANDEQLRTLAFWNLGSLGAASWSVLAVAAPCVILATAVLLRCAAPLDALALGEPEAGHLGVPVQRLKALIVVLTALCVGALTAFTGIILFIGLVAPHMVRLACGPGHRLLMPAAALLGAILVLSADLLARTAVAPAELPIGVVTALLGVPFFLALLVKQRRTWSL